MNYVFITPDGMIFGISQNNKTTDTLTVYADINGSKAPNKGSKDVCVYLVAASGTVVENCTTEFSKTCTTSNFFGCNEEECRALGSPYTWISAAAFAGEGSGFCSMRLSPGTGDGIGGSGRF